MFFRLLGISLPIDQTWDPLPMSAKVHPSKICISALDYVLHGDLGAIRAMKHNWANPARMGVKSDTYEDESTGVKHVFTVNFRPVSKYPLTRAANRFLPDLMGVAIRLEDRTDKVPNRPTTTPATPTQTRDKDLRMMFLIAEDQSQ